MPKVEINLHADQRLLTINTSFNYPVAAKRFSTAFQRLIEELETRPITKPLLSERPTGFADISRIPINASAKPSGITHYIYIVRHPDFIEIVNVLHHRQAPPASRSEIFEKR